VTEEVLRKCKTCGKEKPLSEYRTSKSKYTDREWVRSSCYSCNKIQSNKANRDRYYRKKAAKEGELNSERLVMIVSNLSTRMRKVYEVVPLAEPWTVAQISAELRRKGISRAYNELEACIRQLADLKIVEPCPNNTFIKARVKEKEDMPTLSLPKTTMVTVVGPEPQKEEPMNKRETPVEKISALSQRIDGIIQSLRTLASDMETAALEIEETISKRDQDTQKLRQLQTLLKSLGE